MIAQRAGDAHGCVLETKRAIPSMLFDAAMDVTSAAEAFRLGDTAREMAAVSKHFHLRKPTKPAPSATQHPLWPTPRQFHIQTSRD